MDRIHRFVAYHPRSVLAGIAGLTLAAVLCIVDVPGRTLRLRIETAVMKILPTEGRDWELYSSFRERFGNDEIVFVGLLTDDVFQPGNLARIKRLTERLSHVDGVRRVVSLQNAPDVRSLDGEVEIRSIYDEVPRDAAEAEELRARVLANPVHVGTLVSRDSRATAFLVYPLEMDEREFRRRGIDQQLEAIAAEEAPDARVLMAGTPPLKAATSRILLGDLMRVVPLGFVFMAAISYAIFRSWRAVAIPLSGIGLAQVWTLGSMALWDTPINLVTFIVPPLINAVGFAYSVHVVAEHDDMLRRGQRGPEAVRRALDHVAFPVIMTAVTTAAGFLSQDWLDAYPDVDKTTSLADYVMVVNRAFHDGDPAYYTIPDSKSLISQYLFFLWNDQLAALVDNRFSAANILTRIPSGPSHYHQRILADIEAHLAQVAPPDQAYVTGDAPLIVRVIDEISYGQAVSLSGATLIIYAILALYFRSLRIAFLALLPNALPVLVYFGVLGLSGVTLNAITSLIACIVVGIAVDDTIHFMVRYKECAATIRDPAKATIETMHLVARPVTSTTAALCGGFVVLALSGLRHQVEFGILATCLLGFAWLVDMTFTPALCSAMRLSPPKE